MAKWNIKVEEPKGGGEFIPHTVNDKPLVLDDKRIPIQDQLDGLQAQDNEGRLYGAEQVQP